MSKNDFYEILNKIKTENLFSSQAVELFSSCVGGKFEVELSFLQFTSVFGRQLDSKYDNGFKFDCVTNDQQEVIILFPEGSKTAYMWDWMSTFKDGTKGQNKHNGKDVFAVYIPFDEDLLKEIKSKLPVLSVQGKSGTFYDVIIEKK